MAISTIACYRCRQTIYFVHPINLLKILRNRFPLFGTRQDTFCTIINSINSDNIQQLSIDWWIFNFAALDAMYLYNMQLCLFWWNFEDFQVTYCPIKVKFHNSILQNFLCRDTRYKWWNFVLQPLQIKIHPFRAVCDLSMPHLADKLWWENDRDFQCKTI